MLEECIAVDVVHEHDAEHVCQVGETPAAPDTPLHDHEQEVGDECHPNLYLDGVCALTVEVPQREVLLELLEKQLYFPALAVNLHDVLHFHVHVVGMYITSLTVS